MSSLSRLRILPLVVLLSAAALTLASSTAGAANAMRFAAGFRWFDSERISEDLVSADLDEDGIPDLILAQPAEGAVSVLLAAPGGGFKHRIGYDAGGDPHDIAAFDANGDGHVDVVATNRDTGRAYLLPGRGDGTLGTPRLLFESPDPGPALARDFDGDGLADVVMVVGTDLSRLIFLRGRGDGMFDPPAEIHRGAGPLRMTSVDLPGRRHQGVGVSDAAGAITVLASTPRGRFRVVDEVQLAGVATAICTSDIDGDGLADLIVALATGAPDDTLETGCVIVLRGSASARFVNGKPIDPGFVPSCVTAVDVDGDGWDDILAPDRRGGGLGFLRNDRAGGFEAVARRPSRLGSHRPAIGDWNCDGRVDLVSLGPAGRGAVLLTGQGDGRFGDAIDLDTDFGPAGLWLGDLNDDGVPDLAATDLYTGKVAVLRGDGLGSFALPDAASTYSTRYDPAFVFGARLVPGGPVDLLIAHDRHEGILSRGRNLGDGTFDFAPGDTVHTGGHPTAFLVGDVDGDGTLDALVANLGVNNVVVLRGDGAGGFQLHATLALGDHPPVALALGDLDRDGHADLAVADEEGHFIRIFRGIGGGDFVPAVKIRSGLRPLSVTLADLDGDGNLDVVSGQGAPFPAVGLIVVYRGDGAGGFTPYDPAWTAPVGYEPTRVIVDDFDRDGSPDIAVGDVGSATVTLLPGPMVHGFSGAGVQSLGTRAAVRALVTGDVDRDGWTDLVIGGLVADHIGILRNRSGEPADVLPGASIDVVPGACPNPLAGEGTLRVAIVSGGAFDPGDLLPHSVRLEGVPPLGGEPESGDESGPVDACAVGCGCEGRAPDGVDDVIYTFDAAAVLAALGPVHAGEARPVRLTANLRGGGRLDLADCVVPAVGEGPAADLATAVAAVPSLEGPNPLSSGGRVSVAYTVPAGGAEVAIGVFDVAGRRVASLAHGFVPEGAATASWAPHDADGRAIAPGVYFVRVRIGATLTSARLVLVP